MNEDNWLMSEVSVKLLLHLHSYRTLKHLCSILEICAMENFLGVVFSW